MIGDLVLPPNTCIKSRSILQRMGAGACVKAQTNVWRLYRSMNVDRRFQATVEGNRVLGQAATADIFRRIDEERVARPAVSSQELQDLIMGPGYGDEIYYTYDGIPDGPEHEEVVECVQNIIAAEPRRARARSDSPEIHDPYRKTAKRGRASGVTRTKKSKKRKSKPKRAKARRKSLGRTRTTKKPKGRKRR